MSVRAADKGFTLIELLVAAVLLTTGLTAAAAAFSAAARAQGYSHRVATASRLAEAKLAEIEAQGVEWGSGQGDFAELEQAGEDTGLGDYQYQWEVAATNVDGLVRARVSVWYRGRENNPLTLVLYLATSGGQPS